MLDVEIEAIEFSASNCRTRLPFRFAMVTLTEAPVVIARVALRAKGERGATGAKGERVHGASGDLCVPKWFEKNPSKTIRQDVQTLFDSATRARRAFLGGRGTAFSIWQAAHARCTEGDLASGIRLVDGFGVALVERAIIDATCRAAGLSFRDAIAQDVLGLDARMLVPAGYRDRAPKRTAALLAEPAPRDVLVRHTVGGLDPLRPDDVPDALRGDDGHPVSLEEDIARFGLSAFKLKAGGAPESDAERLADIARVVDEAEVETPLYTLDANESYARVEDIEALLDRLGEDAHGKRILEGLAYLEQPLARDRSLDPAFEAPIRRLAERVPLLIDEADDSIDAFARALELGYRGVSVKNCKGVFRALGNRALCLAHGEGAFQTSEDLTNLPILPLQQDLATVGALGLPHSERNGHHFFSGLDVLPRAEAEAALAAHPDLYERRDGRIRLRIEKGRLSLACQDEVGFGSSIPIEEGARTTLEIAAAELPE